MLRNRGAILSCVGMVLVTMLPAHSFPQNYLSRKLGASVTTDAQLAGKAEPNALLSDGPVSHGRFGLAGVEQPRVFTVDLGQVRKFDRIQLGCGGVEGIVIEVSSKSGGSFKKVFEKSELGVFQILRLPVVKARWVKFDFGVGKGGGVNSVRIYKGYEHPKLVAVTKILHEKIKPGVPGLEKFYTTAKAGNWPRACKELRAYYAAKLKTRTGEDDVKYIDPNPAYDLTRAKAMADEGKLDHAGIVNIQKVPIDWVYMKTGDWYEHKNFLNRGNRVGVMADAAYNVGTEKWNKEFRDVFYDWVDANPKPEIMSGADYPSWRTLDSAGRSGWLVSRFPQVTFNKAQNDELWANYLLSIWEHADYLKNDNFTGGNWLANVSSAVMGMAMEFPEFSDVKIWLAYGKDAFERNVMRDIHPDGKEFEDAPGYVCFAFNGMFHTLQALDKEGVAVSQEARERLNKVQDWIGAVTQPDGTMPNIGDWGGGEPYPLKNSWPFFKREDIRYILTKGKEGVKPAWESINFPDGQWSTMRGPYETQPYEDARHLTFHSSQGAHGHRDMLGVTAYGYGRELLIDPGTRSYEGRDRQIYPSVPYHNTICVDGKGYEERNGKTEQWSSTSAIPGHPIDYVIGSHQGYPGLTVRRMVIFVKPDYWIVHDDIIGEGEHTYDQNWHFAEDAGIVEDPLTKAVHTSYATGGNLLMIPVDPETVKSESKSFYIAKSRMANDTGEVESKGWKYSKTGATPQSFDTILYPYSGSTVPKVSVKRYEVEGAKQHEATCLEVTIGDRTDSFLFAPAGVRDMKVTGKSETATNTQFAASFKKP